MKKLLPYVLIALLVVAIGFLFLGNKSQNAKKINTRITLSKKDKNPYGAYVFHESLKTFFPGADFKINYSEPGNNKNFGSNELNQLYVILQAEFFPTTYEVDDLITFIERGNNVFISSFDVGSNLYRYMNTRPFNRNLVFYPDGNFGEDSMQVSLLSPPFAATTAYAYPGALMEGYFKKYDSIISGVIGKNKDGVPNLLHFKKGDGNLYIHLSPLAFSNYFLLYNNNIGYLEKIFSLLPAETPVVIWDEYFSIRKTKDNNRGWFNAIMKNRYFSAGILTALLFLLIYALTEIKRKQRVIPVMAKPVNDSMEFVKTMGLLYYERGDHTNLARKMSAYFLEHVRSRYKIFAKNLNRDFAEELSYKSGVDERLVKEIVSQVNRLNAEGVFEDTELIALQRNIEAFYNNE